jgi:tRNA(His) 5'-end guanylyltransferase
LKKYTKGKAFKTVLKYLDNQKPSDMQNFKDEMKSTDLFVLNGVTKILAAKTKVGIDKFNKSLSEISDSSFFVTNQFHLHPTLPLPSVLLLRCSP